MIEVINVLNSKILNGYDKQRKTVDSFEILAAVNIFVSMLLNINFKYKVFNMWDWLSNTN